MQKKAIKINLALLDEASKVTQNAITARKELIQFVQDLQKISSLVDKAKAKAKEGNGIYDNGKSVATKIASQMENIGIEPRSSAEYNKLWEAINDVQDQILKIEYYTKNF
jgi:hypothetical protein